MHHLLQDIGIAVIAATVLGLAAQLARQPVILGYLVAGALIGPAVGFGWVADVENIEIISEIGLILLLFVIGLEMNPGQVLAAGRQLLVAGLGQFPLCVALGVGVFAALGHGLMGNHADGLYFAIACALSSTAIVVKALHDRLELDTLPGRLTLGILVIQDVYAILVLAFQPNFAQPEILPVIKALAASVALLGMGYVVSKFILARVFAWIARSPEMVVATSLGWCALVAGVAGAMGLSKEMGALVAGLSIGVFPYSLHVTAKTLPLRDFFLTLFFVALGMKILPPTWSMAVPLVAIVVVTFASRLLVVWPLLAITGAGRRTAVITSLNLAQVSEFALVIAALGLTYGHISSETAGVITYGLAITAVLTSYVLRWNHQIFQGIDRLLGGQGATAVDDTTCDRHPIAILGFHRGARALVDRLKATDPEALGRILVVDFNPETLRQLAAEGIAGRFGDIGSVDSLHHAHLDHARLVISSVPDSLLKGIDNLGLVKAVRVLAPHARIIATAETGAARDRLLAAGAAEVINPYDLLADGLVGEITGLAAP